MIEIILLLVFAALLLNYLVFLSNIYKGLFIRENDAKEKLPNEFVSVIIPFRNESNNILQSLKSVSCQNYPTDKFEVIYVNDDSTDDSFIKIVEAQKPENVRVLNFSDHSANRAFKKKAIGFGIENSIGEIIVTTDADCIHNHNWLENLLSSFDSDTGLISGPVSFLYSENIFSKIQSLEFAGLILSGAGLIGIGKPTICNGANLAFRKSVYQKINGYSEHIHLSSGEDELLMQKISEDTNYSVKFCWNKEAIVYTRPIESYKAFFQQRKRWASKGLFYKNKLLIARLILIYLFYLGLIIQGVLSVIISELFILSLVISLLFKFVFEYKILVKGVNFLFSNKILKYFFLTELFQIFYLTTVGILGLFGNLEWKERKMIR